MMKPKSVAEATQIAKAVLSPGVWQFIDQKKFTRSVACEWALHAVVKHINEHGDYTGALPWLRVFADTEFFQALQIYFSENTRMVFTAHDQTVEIGMSNISVSEYQHFLACYGSSKAKTLEGVYGRGWKLQGTPNQSYVDMMDTKLRLPGSFENGERR